jgi:hypothetical protein
MEYNIKMQIRHLCSYITDKSAVLNYLNRENNLRLTYRDIQEALDSAPKKKQYNVKPLKPSPLITTNNAKGYDPLARALFQYHADRTTGAEHEYWLSKMLTRKKKKKEFTVNL